MNRRVRALVILWLACAAGVLLQPSMAHATIYVYSCVLSTKQETPPTASFASGGGTFVIDTDANTVNYRISFAKLSTAETSAYITGFGVGGLFFLPAGNPKVGTWNYADADEEFILSGSCYAEIRTVSNGSGEVRGQIVPLNAVLDGAQEVPANATTGTAWLTATIDTAQNKIKYRMAYSGLTGAVTAAHFHGSANYGAPAGVKVTLLVAPSPMSGLVSYAEADEGAILTGLWYVNLHTAANPGGEIRGQLSPRVVPMDGQQESPPTVATINSGYALCSVDLGAKALGYDVHITQLSGAETAAHIHGYATAGVNAGVVQPLASGARKIGTWTYPAANETDVLGGRTYFNSHTAVNPGGEIRGQILFLPGPGLLDVGEPPSRIGLTGLAAAPNPFANRTALTFTLSHAGNVSLAIMSVDGRRVRNVEPTLYEPGPHSYHWDGLDDSGNTVAPGVYFAIVHGPDGQSTTRLARIK